MQFKNISIRKKIFIIVLPILIISAFIFGYREFNQTSNIIVSNFDGNLENTIDLINNKLIERITFTQNLLKMLAFSNLSKAKFNFPNDKTVDSIVYSFLDSFENLNDTGIFEVSLLNSTGFEIAKAEYRNLRGKFYAVPIRGLKLQDRTTEAYFIETKNLVEGQFFVDEIHLQRQDGDIRFNLGEVIPVLKLGAPVYDNGNFLGVVEIGLYFDFFIKSDLESLNKLGSLNVSIVDSHGYFLYDSSSPWSSPQDLASNFTIFERYENIEYLVPANTTKSK